MVAWRSAMVLLLLSACAQPQLLEKTPVAGPEALGLDRPMTPLTGPVTVGAAPWMPFSRFCQSSDELVLVSGQSFPKTRRTCATLTSAPADAGWRRLTITATEGEFAGAALTLDHSPTRQVRNVSYKASPSADLSVQDVRVRNQTFEARLRATAIPSAMWVARQGESAAVSESISRFEGFRDPKDWTVTCRVEGSSAVNAREVIVTSCDAENPIRMTDPGRRFDLSATVTLTHWVAVDVATGANMRDATASRVEGRSTAAGRNLPVSATGWATSTLD
jgi:hypothetical protein